MVRSLSQAEVSEKQRPMRQPLSFLLHLCMNGMLLAVTVLPPCLAQTQWTIDTIAGRGGIGTAVTAPLDSPNGVALDGSGNLYIADTGNSRIRKTGGGSFAQIATPGASATDYQDTGLSPNTTYTYRLAAVNSVGQGHGPPRSAPPRRPTTRPGQTPEPTRM